MNKQIDTLLQKQMTRKEFLATLGFGAASVMGFSTVIKMLTGKSVEHHVFKTSGYGYGSSPYGGGKD
jgi:hypothetical protein